MKNYIVPFFLCLIITSATGCSEYWWTRGQPPSTETLFVRANERISESLTDRSSIRPDIAANAIEVQNGLKILQSSDISSAQVSTALKTVEVALKNLERKVSFGNRPPLNELSGQLRALEGEFKQNSDVEESRVSALRLFGARVLMYLSSELNVPAPDQIG